MPSVNISRPALIFDGRTCQRRRQLQTFESLNRGNCLTGFQQTSAAREQSESEQEAGRKLPESGRRKKMEGARCFSEVSCGHPKPGGQERCCADTALPSSQRGTSQTGSTERSFTSCFQDTNPILEGRPLDGNNQLVICIPPDVQFVK